MHVGGISISQSFRRIHLKSDGLVHIMIDLTYVTSFVGYIETLAIKVKSR